MEDLLNCNGNSDINCFHTENVRQSLIEQFALMSIEISKMFLLEKFFR